MSQPLTSTPKGKAQPFRIVFAQGGGTPATTVRKVGRPKKNSMSDLEAAVHSITEDGAPVKSSEQTSLIRTVNQSPQKILTFNDGDGNKVEKIVFLPKFIQKKVTLLRDPLPKKMIRTEALVHSPQQKSRNIVVSQGGSALRDIVAAVNDKVNSLPKKRKLGDLALESWQANRKVAPIALVSQPALLSPALPVGPPVLCRLCGTSIQDQVIELFDDTTGAITPTGAKLKTITGNEVLESGNTPTGCCKQCSMKVQVCFSLLVELQAADVVARDTFAAAEENEINPNVRIFTCRDCDQEVIGMKDFIRHHEAHVQERTIGSSNVTHVSKVDQINMETGEPKESLQSLMESARLLIDNDIEDDGLPAFQNEAGDFVCELCGRIFKYKYLLFMHRKAPRKPQKVAEGAVSNCFFCGLPKLGLSQSDDEPCLKCQQKEEDLEDGGEEYEVVPENELPDDYLACRICNKVLKKCSYTVHVAKHGDKRFFCDVCNKGFTYKYALKQHIERVHESTQPYTYVALTDTCCICDEKFGDSNELREHMVSVHGSFNTALLSCTLCGKTFPELFKLRMHLRVLHEYELPQNSRSSGEIQHVVCHVCGMVLSSANATKIHMKDVHGVSASTMQAMKQACELCGKEFSVKQNLVNHINTAHLNVKPMPCDICGARFAKHSSLIFHRFRHTGEKPFKCTVCQRVYRQRNDVIRHLARHVRDGEVSYEEAYALNISPSKFVVKRHVYLKDSTIKGLIDMTRGPITKKKSRRISGKPVLYFGGPGEDEIYEEVVAPEEGSLPAAEQTEEEEEGKSQEQYENLQFILGEDGNINYVLQEDGTEYSGDVQYIIQEENEVEPEAIEETEYVIPDSVTQYIDENGKEVNIKYIVSENGLAQEGFIKQGDGVVVEEII